MAEASGRSAGDRTAPVLEIRGLKQMDDYAKFVPGLSLGVREPGGTTIVFRGVASSGLQFGAVSSSALYLDEQPITQSGRNPDPRLIDIERLEALRGPRAELHSRYHVANTASRASRPMGGASGAPGHRARHVDRGPYASKLTLAGYWQATIERSGA